MFIYQLICFKVIRLGLLLVVSWDQLPCWLSLQFAICGRGNTEMKQGVSISQMNPIRASISCFFFSHFLLFLDLLSPFSYFFKKFLLFSYLLVFRVLLKISQFFKKGTRLSNKYGEFKACLNDNLLKLPRLSQCFW